MRTPSAEPTPTPALAPLLSPLEDDDDVDDDGDVCDVFIAVEEVGEAVVVIAGPVDVGTAEADVAPVIVIDREFEADEE